MKQKNSKRCIRCGKLLTHYHFLTANNGERGYVCTDDRNCGPWRARRLKTKRAAKIKALQRAKKNKWHDA